MGSWGPVKGIWTYIRGAEGSMEESGGLWGGVPGLLWVYRRIWVLRRDLGVYRGGFRVVCMSIGLGLEGHREGFKDPLRWYWGIYGEPKRILEVHGVVSDSIGAPRMGLWGSIGVCGGAQEGSWGETPLPAHLSPPGSLPVGRPRLLLLPRPHCSCFIPTIPDEPGNTGGPPSGIFRGPPPDWGGSPRGGSDGLTPFPPPPPQSWSRWSWRRRGGIGTWSRDTHCCCSRWAGPGGGRGLKGRGQRGGVAKRRGVVSAPPKCGVKRWGGV